MKIERFEDIEAWQLARELARRFTPDQEATLRDGFWTEATDQEAAGSAMHNIAEGFDSETNAEFVRFLRYAKCSCTEVQSELYVAADEEYISTAEFQDGLRTSPACARRHSRIHQTISRSTKRV